MAVVRTLSSSARICQVVLRTRVVGAPGASLTETGRPNSNVRCVEAVGVVISLEDLPARHRAVKDLPVFNHQQANFLKTPASHSSTPRQSLPLPSQKLQVQAQGEEILSKGLREKWPRSCSSFFEKLQSSQPVISHVEMCQVLQRWRIRLIFECLKPPLAQKQTMQSRNNGRG